PLYEAKMINQLNERAGDFGSLREGEKGHVLPSPSENQLADPNYGPLPRYWVEEKQVRARLKGRWAYRWLLGWRDITDARASARTVVAAVIPRTAVGHQLPIALPEAPAQSIACLTGNLDSFALDYIARQKIGGIHLTFFILNQLP